MKQIVTIALAVAAAPTARAEPAAQGAGDRHAGIVLTAQGKSLSLGRRRAVNNSPPVTELRLARRLARVPWAGTHMITLTVTDADANTDTDAATSSLIINWLSRGHGAARLTLRGRLPVLP